MKEDKTMRTEFADSRRCWWCAAPALLLLLTAGCGSVQNARDALAFREYRGYRPTARAGEVQPASLPVAFAADSETASPTRQDDESVSRSAESTAKANVNSALANGSPADPAAADEDAIQLVGLQPPPNQIPVAPELLPGPDQIAEPQVPLPASEKLPDDRYPINLGTALQLAGANNLQIALATERVREALARLDGAEVLWVPSLNAGVGYNSHVGQIQATEGPVVEVNRESLFVGGGPVLSGAPLTGGSGGPARLFVDISPADIYFAPLAARQTFAGSQAEEAAVFNDTLLQVTVAYLELLRAQSEVAIAEETIRYAEELLEMAEEFVEAGIGLEADAERARAELADRRRQLAAAEERLRVISAGLAWLLRLEPNVVLAAVDDQPVPLSLIAEDHPLDALIAQGLTYRPELARHQAQVAETLQRYRQEKLRPWVPNLHAGLSSGGFGGGGKGSFGDFSDRTDFDFLAIWELRNFGLGNHALQRERESQHRQAHLTYEQSIDRIGAEVAEAYQQVQYRRRQIEQAEIQVKSAARALPLNFRGIQGRVLRVIEAQQAINALAAARNNYLAAVTQYNQAQFALLRALGQSPDASHVLAQAAQIGPVPPAPALAAEE